MDNYEFLLMAPQLVPVLAHLLILGATVYAITRQPSLATGLMLFGAVARLICGLFFSLGIMLFDNDYQRYTMVAIPFQILVFAGTIAFIIGFFLFAHKLFSAPAEV